MSVDTDDRKFTLLLYLAVFPLLATLFWLVPSYYEARTYRRLTGAEVTMWDAMWVELRVQEAVIPTPTAVH